MIKYKIKRLQFVKPKWFSTNPCLEIVLPVSQEPVRLTVNMDFASLYNRVEGYQMGELGVITPYEGLGYTRRHRRRGWEEYIAGDFTAPINFIEDEQPF